MPQYQVAVTKAKLMRCASLMRVVAEAQERYYLINNTYALKFSDLDVSIPEGTTKIESGEAGEDIAFYPWGVSLDIQSSNQFVYCVSTKEDIHYGWKLIYSKRTGQQICFAQKTDSIGIRICQNLSGMKTASDNWGNYTEYVW